LQYLLLWLGSTNLSRVIRSYFLGIALFHFCFLSLAAEAGQRSCEYEVMARINSPGHQVFTLPVIVRTQDTGKLRSQGDSNAPKVAFRSTHQTYARQYASQAAQMCLADSINGNQPVSCSRRISYRSPQSRNWGQVVWHNLDQPLKLSVVRSVCNDRRATGKNVSIGIFLRTVTPQNWCKPFHGSQRSPDSDLSRFNWRCDQSNRSQGPLRAGILELTTPWTDRKSPNQLESEARRGCAGRGAASIQVISWKIQPNTGQISLKYKCR